MEKRKFILVVYDISSDKRRRHLHQVLSDYGSPVQYSVFECYLTDDDIIRLRKAINKAIRPRIDQVRIYHLCLNCLKKTEITSGIAVITNREKTIVI